MISTLPSRWTHSGRQGHARLFKSRSGRATRYASPNRFSSSSSTMTTTAQTGGTTFVALGKDVYLRKPDTNVSESQSSSDDPNVILIFGWMGAQLPHIHKYTKVYEDMYPHATQILVRSRPLFFLSPEFIRRRNIQPAVEALNALGMTSAHTEHKLLVHSFSNGGAFQMLTLSNALSKSPIPLTRSALIFDSAPGQPTLKNGITAFSHSIPRGLSFIFKPLLVTWLSLTGVWAFVRRSILRRPNEWETLFGRLSAPNLLPWFTAKTPRLYFYSKADQLVEWKPLQAHIGQVKQELGSGGVVREEMFEQTPHVAHARVYPQRYWSAVRKLWDETKA